jgi:signal peptidase I
MKKNKPIKKSAFREWVEAAVFAAFLAFCVIRPFLIQAFKIPTGSMRPTLLEGDLILVSKFVYGPKVPFTKYRLPGLTRPKRGDVIVFIYPEDRKKDFIKRLVGFPGDTIEIKSGTVFVNGNVLNDSVFGQHYYYNRGEFAREGEKLVVPEGNFFVLGDNSASSKDSRYWGFVPWDNVLGRAEVIYWPLNRIRVIK